MDKRYHTIRMENSPKVGDIFSSSLLDPAPAPDAWWKVMFAPVQMVSGGWAVTFQECIPLAPAKGRVGECVHRLLRTPAPEPTLGMIYAEVMALRQRFDNLIRVRVPDSFDAMPTKRVLTPSPVQADWKPLNVEEAEALTAMVYGAPWARNYCEGLLDVLVMYDELRASGQRPVDPAAAQS